LEPPKNPVTGKGLFFETKQRCFPVKNAFFGVGNRSHPVISPFLQNDVVFDTLVMKVILYRKSGCPWAAAVMGFLNELSIPFDARNISVNERYLREVEQKSGQSKSPTLDIDGKILADASVEDVAEHLETLGWKV
jgi:glutaredoxin 3